MRQAIRNGVPGTGMPAFRFSDAELDAIIAHIGRLAAPAIDRDLPGDPSAGEAFFFGKGDCARCHIVNGRGGTLGPDLSNLGRDRRAAQIEDALRHPKGGATSIKLRDGSTLRGMVRNENTFDIQIQSLDGLFHSVAKSQVLSVARETAPLMPPVAASDAAFRDLMAFLSRLTTARTAVTASAGGSLSGGIPFAEIVKPKAGNWPTYNGVLGGNRHSELKQIDTSNVSGLAPRWMFTYPSARRPQMTPLVVDGVMYASAGNEAFAIDAATGRTLWHFARPASRGVAGDAANAVNRGVALLGPRLFMVTDNAHLLALHRDNGALLWEVELADYRQNYGATSAPLVVGDLVISGMSGGDEGARGFLDAYHADTGERAWRFWTIPAPGESLASTWVGSALPHGCGATWFTGTYDAETGIVYWPVGNPCPDYNGDERKGDNLYSDSILALDAKTGKLRWYFQFTPHDLHDWDASETPMLLDAGFGGRPRKLLVQANRNGFFYVLDRLTGEFLLGRPFVKKLTWASGLDAKGRPIPLPGNDPTPEGTKTCPAVEGATNFFSPAYNPSTGLFYLNALESCNIYTKSPATWEAGRSYYGGGTRRVPDESGQKFLRALDLQTGRVVWEVPQTGPAESWGGVLSTAGGLVFFCEDSGAFAAADARTGKVLWHFNTSQLWKASPMTYSVNGKQYVAVAAGGNIIAFGLP